MCFSLPDHPNGMCLLISRGSFDGEDKGLGWIIKILVLTRPSDNVCNFFMVNSFINYFLRAALLWLLGDARKMMMSWNIWYYFSSPHLNTKFLWFTIHTTHFTTGTISTWAWTEANVGVCCTSELHVIVPGRHRWIYCWLASLYITMGIKQIEHFTCKADRGKTPLCYHC